MRRTSSKPWTGFSTLQNTRLLTTVSKVAARNGRASPLAITSGVTGERCRARASAAASGFRPITLAPPG